MIAVKPTVPVVRGIDPEQPQVRSLLARLRARAGRWFKRHSTRFDRVEPLFWDRQAAFMLGLAAASQGEWSLAERELTNGNGPRAICDPYCLNLLGVVYEIQGNWGLARQCYSRAVRADRSYEPPRINLRRYYELITFGRTSLAACLCDEKDVLS